MSYASKFTSSNRFAALSDDADVAAAAVAAAQPAPAPTRVWNHESTTGAARAALAEETRRPTQAIFRKNTANDAPVHTAFQGMRSSGYQGLFKKAPEPPKSYEEEFPSLGGKKGAAAAVAAPAAPAPASKFAEMAKSWAKTEADAAAAAAEAAAARRLEQQKAAAEDRNTAIYASLMQRRRAALYNAEPEYDYNEEVYRQQDAFEDEEEEGRSSPYSSHTPPYDNYENDADRARASEDYEH
jgi:hypothetical protein